MNDDQKREGRIKHAQSQSWAWLREHQEDIQRIANKGRKETQQDDALVRIMANCILAEIKLREAEALGE